MALSRNINFLFVVLIAFFFPSQGEMYASDQVVATDSVQSWTDEEWKKATDGVDYSEKKEEEKENEYREINYAERSNWFNELFTSSLGKVISILVIFSVLVYTLLRLLGNSSKNRDNKLKKELSFSLESIEGNLEETDLERFLRLALEANDYKTAVRILYLGVIQQLHHKKWILWKKDKTNRDFLNEMRERESYSGFRNLTQAFEVVWYGDAEVSKVEFDMLKKLFSAYQNEVDGKGK